MLDLFHVALPWMGNPGVCSAGDTVFSLALLLTLPPLPFVSSPPAFVTKLDTVSRTIEWDDPSIYIFILFLFPFICCFSYILTVM